jgi:hypothetical protein
VAVVKGRNVTCVGLWWGTKALDPTSDDTTRSVVRELDVGDMIMLFGRKMRKRDSMNELTINQTTLVYINEKIEVLHLLCVVVVH